jgi:hypothetical protein
MRLDHVMLVRVQPDPSTEVLARLAIAAEPAPVVLALRNGNLYYTAASLFHQGAASPQLRQLFFWLVDQAVPRLAFRRARERAGAAMAAVIRARERAATASPATAAAAMQLLDQARTVADRAKTLASGDQYAESGAAADQAFELIDRALKMIESH